ncbi:MAG TPA: UDP-N-acetylmuramoyl-L-alanine--D-glutamate ligase [Actinomycetota bacterium]|nr:UDP-N-acetylmuramoyl-L-alanine--D-glutamate ligase [Actinomycetota bacterium]
MSPELKDSRVLVLGLGRSGLAVAEALLEAGALVRASDSRPDLDADPRVHELRARGAEIELGGHARAGDWIDASDLVVPSPGISPSSDLLVRASEAGVPVISEIELAFRSVSAPVVAVTGTNGKTTTCRMIGAILSAEGREAVVCGNIGRPFVTAALEHPFADAFVVEVSSFQLYFCESFHPVVSVITNIAPDHLDWHGSLAAYREAKGRIAARQTPDDWFVHPAAQPDLAELAPPSGPRRIAFAREPVRGGDAVWTDGPAMYARIGSDDVDEIGPLGPLADLGAPFVEDGLAAAAASIAYGVPSPVVGEALRSFTPDRHRVETVARYRDVLYVDDSKATNPHAAAAAIRSFNRVVLIAGGRNKGLDLSELTREAGRLAGVVAIGEAGPEVEAAFRATSVPVLKAASMEEAVELASSMAGPGDAILLSPACSSYDRYRDYAERGEAFQEAVRRFTEGAGGVYR